MSLLLALQTAGGPVTITGTLAATELGDTSSFAGLIEHTGTLAAIEDGDSASFTGLIDHTGTLAVTEGSDTASFVGLIDHTGTLSVTEGSDTAAFSGTVTGSGITITGDLIVTEDGDTASFSGNVSSPIQEIQGQGNWYKTKPKFRIKLVKRLTRELEEVRAKKEDAEGFKHAELVIYEALLHEKLVEQFDESLKNLVTEIEYKKTERILNEIKLGMENKKLLLQLEEEEIMFAIISLL